MIKELINISELQKTKEIGKNNSKKIKEQISNINFLLNKENLEKRTLEKFIAKVTDNNLHREFNIEPDKFDKLVRERDLLNGIISQHETIFSTIKTDLNQIIDLLNAELSHVTTSELIKAENDLLEKISKDISTIIEIDEDFRKYFTFLDKLKYNKKWIKNGQIITKIVSGIWVSVTPNGLENIPAHGPCLIVPRHYHSAKDAISMMATIKRPFYMAASVAQWGLAGSWWSNMWDKIGGIPFVVENRGRKIRDPKGDLKVQGYKEAHPEINTRSSLRKALNHLRHGDAVLIFAEDDGKTFFQNFEHTPGEPFSEVAVDAFVWLAIQAKKERITVPIIPVGMKYMDFAPVSQTIKQFLPNRVIATFNKPEFILDEVLQMKNAEELAYITERTRTIFEIIKQTSV